MFYNLIETKPQKKCITIHVKINGHWIKSTAGSLAHNGFSGLLYQNYCKFTLEIVAVISAEV